MSDVKSKPGSTEGKRDTPADAAVPIDLSRDREQSLSAHRIRICRCFSPSS